MAGRSPARFLAPIALVAFAFVFYSILQDGREPSTGDDGSPARTTATPAATKESGKKSSKKKRKSYTVKAGDTPSGIAEKAGISLDTLYELNPDLDPQTLAPGQRIRLTE
jgi:LysM repeat protein